MYQSAADRFGGELDEAQTEVDDAINRAVERGSELLQSKMFKDNRAYAKAQEMREQLNAIGLGVVEGKQAYTAAKEGFHERYGHLWKKGKDVAKDATKANEPVVLKDMNGNTVKPPKAPAAADLDDDGEPLLTPGEMADEILPKRTTKLSTRVAQARERKTLGRPMKDYLNPETNRYGARPGSMLRDTHTLQHRMGGPDGRPISMEQNEGLDFDVLKDELTEYSSGAERIGEFAGKVKQAAGKGLASIKEGLPSSEKLIEGASKAGELAKEGVSKAGELAEAGLSKAGPLMERGLGGAGAGVSGYETAQDLFHNKGLSYTFGGLEAAVGLAVPEAAPLIMGADLVIDDIAHMFGGHHKKKMDIPQRPAPPPVTSLQRGNIALPTLSTMA